jgi:hypothetical protein
MISATIRDIAIIIIAVQTIVIGALLGLLVWQIWRLVKLVQTEIKPIITNTQETVNTVRGTTAFVSEQVVDPVIRTSRTIARLRGALQSLTADLRPQPRRQVNQTNQTPPIAPPPQ